MARFPAAFEDKTGKITRLTGELEYLPDPAATPGDVLTVQPDGSIAAAPGGGGSPPVTAVYQGNPVTIANASGAALTWDTLAYGTELFDRSSPAGPLVLADGVYAIAVDFALNASPGLITAGGCANGQFGFGTNPASLNAVLPGGVTATQSLLQNTVTGTLELDAGELVTFYVANDDGVASRDFRIAYATVAKIG